MVPVQYAVHLIPNLADNTFLGSQTVEIDVLSTTSKIMLNVVNMAIDAASLSGRDIGEIGLTPQTFDALAAQVGKLPDTTRLKLQGDA